jgi:FMN-dependent oxidoreductase (nitrilotriacetate monooxygenase family)
MTQKQMKLGAFFNLPGHHVASWRYPSTDPRRTLNLEYLKELAQTAERGKFDMIFFADILGLKPSKNFATSTVKLDPLMIITALAAVTRNIGLTATLTTTYNEPFQVARKFAAIDHLSGGRAGWNVVTSGNEKEAQLFGKEKHLEHARRYERAEEFVELTKKLWFSIEAEALVIDKENGTFLDVEKIHPVDHQGEWFKVQGLLDAPSTPQGHPVIAGFVKVADAMIAQGV